MSNPKSEKFSNRFLAVLVLMSMCGPLGMNIILPSISSYQVEFNTDYASSQLTLTFYLAAVAVGQLVYGPLSDRFGRRPIVLIGLSIMVAGTLMALFAISIEMLIAGRMIQAFGACSGMVMGRSMVRDRYDQETAATVIAYLTMAIVLAPTLAPLLGGVLEDTFGWQSHYVFILVFAALALLIVNSALPETLAPEKRRTAKFGELFLSFGVLLKNPTFFAYAFQVAFATSAYFAFLGGSSYVLVDLMGGTATQLGVLFVLVSVAYILGNFGTAKLARKVGIYKVVLAGCIIALFGPIFLFLWEITYGLDPYSFFGLVGVVALGNGLCITSGLAAAISADPDRIGAASGLAGSMQIGFGAVSTFAAGSLLSYFVDTPIPLIFVIMVCVTLGLASFLIGTSLERRRHTEV